MSCAPTCSTRRSWDRRSSGWPLRMPPKSTTSGSSPATSTTGWRRARKRTCEGVLHGAECAGEEDERFLARGDPQLVDLAYDDPVVAGGVFGHDLALEGGEGIGQERCAVGSGLPVEAGEAVRAGGCGADREWLVLSSQHVHAETPSPPHAGPGERATRGAERHQGRFERDRRERVDDQSGGLAVWRRCDEGDAGGEPAECVAERAWMGARRAPDRGWCSCGAGHLSGVTAVPRGRLGRGSRRRGWRRVGA